MRWIVVFLFAAALLAGGQALADQHSKGQGKGGNQPVLGLPGDPDKAQGQGKGQDKGQGQAQGETPTLLPDDSDAESPSESGKGQGKSQDKGKGKKSTTTSLPEDGEDSDQPGKGKKGKGKDKGKGKKKTAGDETGDGEDSEETGKGKDKKGKKVADDDDDDRSGKRGQVLSDNEKSTIRDYFDEGRAPSEYRKAKALPPGIALKLSRGGTLPPGIAKRDLPDDLESSLPKRLGEKYLAVGEDVVLVDEASNVIVDVMRGVLK
jgi:hypothetical protein